MKIYNRINQAIGGSANNRTLASIRNVAWHYTATTNRTIEGHEDYWRRVRGWFRGGYHFYIDRQGRIWQNYTLTTTTNGVRGHNSTTVHVSVEASSKNNYTQAQLNARHWLTRHLIKRLPNVTADRVLGHNEFSNQSTACPGYTKAEMNAFRRQLKNGNAPKAQPARTSSVTGLAGATLVKNEDAYFLATSNIKVRTAPSTRARQTGTLKKGQSINYKKVYRGNGYRWLQYTGYSGNTLYLPYRPENQPNNQWGTFHSTRPAGKGSAPKRKTVDQMAREIIDGKHGQGHENRRKSLGISQSEYQKVRNRVNQLAK